MRQRVMDRKDISNDFLKLNNVPFLAFVESLKSGLKTIDFYNLLILEMAFDDAVFNC